MAGAAAVLDTTPNSTTYSITEDGNAVDTIQIDVPDDAEAAGRLETVLEGLTFANQAAARTWAEENLVISAHRRVSTQAGATAPAGALLDPNISGAAAGNFRLDYTGAKAANGDTATFIVTVTLRHSLVA